MKILTRYLLREHIGPFFFALTALTSIMLLQFIGKRLSDLVGKGLPWQAIVEFLLLSVPFTVAMTLPMALLVAVLYAFSRLASENEITAMRANGVSMFSLMGPVVVSGIIMSVVMLVFNDQILSRANHRLSVLQANISSTKPSFALKEQVINTIVDQKLYLRAAHIDRGSSRMKDIVIYDLSDPAHRRTIYGDSGTLAVAPNGVDLLLKLYDGVMHDVPTKQPAQLTRLFYRTDQFRVKDATNSFKESNADSASKGDREMTVCEMQSALARADYGVRQAEFSYEDAQALELILQGNKGVKRPEKPVAANPAGLGRLYCGFLRRLFDVKTVHAAEVWPAGAFTQQPPVQQPPVQQPPVQHPPVQQNPPTGRVAGAAGAGAGMQPIVLPTGEVLLPSPSIVLRELKAGQTPLTLNDLTMRAEAGHNLWQAEGFQRRRYDIEIQKKFAIAAACIIFVLLGPPIALRFPRGGVGLVIGVSFATFALNYVGLIGGEPLANQGDIPPWLAMWGTNLVMLVIGLVLVARMNRVSGTTRGGDWTEIREAAKLVLARIVRPRRSGTA